jgi:hypothetical protein
MRASKDAGPGASAFALRGPLRGRLRVTERSYALVQAIGMSA